LRNELYGRIKDTAIDLKIVLISETDRSNEAISEKLLCLLEIKDKKITLKRKVIISLDFWDVLKEYLHKFCDKIIKIKRI